MSDNHDDKVILEDNNDKKQNNDELSHKIPMRSNGLANGDKPTGKQPMDKKKKRTLITRAVICVSLIALAICIYGLINEINEESDSQSYYENLDFAERYPAPVVTVAPITETDTVIEPGPTPIPFYPYMDFDAAREEIPDLIGWVKCEGTPIDYPIVKGPDNKFYLTHLSNKQYNKRGAIFLEENNSTDFSDKSTFIYGHNLRSDNMFGSLDNYNEQAYYEEHPVVMLYTPTRNYEIVLVAGYVLNPKKNPPFLSFKNNDSFLNYISGIRELSTFDSGIEVNPEDQIATLCTCDYTISNGRYALVGILKEAYYAPEWLTE